MSHEHTGTSVRMWGNRKETKAWLSGYDTARKIADTTFTDLYDRVSQVPHAPACPGDAGCWCPISKVLKLMDPGEEA